MPQLDLTLYEEVFGTEGNGGKCTDLVGNSYGYVYDDSAAASPSECAVFCQTLGNLDHHVGFNQVGAVSTEDPGCYCLYTNGFKVTLLPLLSLHMATCRGLLTNFLF